jgi:glycosyltransferase involved in cell wall biosynthesis
VEKVHDKTPLLWMVDRTVNRNHFPYLTRFFAMMSSAYDNVSLICEEENELYDAGHSLGIPSYLISQLADHPKPSIQRTAATLQLLIAHRKTSIVHLISEQTASLFTFRNLLHSRLVHYLLPQATYCSFTPQPNPSASFSLKALLGTSQPNFVTSGYPHSLQLSRRFSHKIEYLPAYLHLPSDLPANRSASPFAEGEWGIATVAPLEKPYNIDFLIRTFDHLAKRRDNLRFVVIGDGSERIKLMSLGLRGKILWLRERPDVAQYLGYCHAVMFAPFAPLPVEAEHALAAGTPVIVPHTPGMENLIFDPRLGYVYTETIPEKLADEVDRNLGQLTASEMRVPRRILWHNRYSVSSFYDFWLRYYKK